MKKLGHIEESAELSEVRPCVIQSSDRLLAEGVVAAQHREQPCAGGRGEGGFPLSCRVALPTDLGEGHLRKVAALFVRPYNEHRRYLRLQQAPRRIPYTPATSPPGSSESKVSAARSASTAEQPDRARNGTSVTLQRVMARHRARRPWLVLRSETEGTAAQGSFLSCPVQRGHVGRGELGSL
jgi:hypothetical protein